jgi:hypothetical protein
MSKYKTIYTEVEVDVDISEFDSEDLIEELESRSLGFAVSESSKNLLETIWLKRREGRDYQYELDQLIYAGLGKIV